MAVSITATPIVNGVTVTSSATTITASNVAFGATTAAAISSSTTGTVTATNVQDAIEQLAAQNFRSDDAPSGANLDQGDLWYDTNDDQLKIYRETSPGTFAFVPIMIGDSSADSDTIDAGSF